MNDVGNQYSARVIVAPISSSTERVYPFEVAIPAGPAGTRPGKILLGQIRSIDNSRLGLDRSASLAQVDRALHISLGLRCPSL